MVCFEGKEHPEKLVHAGIVFSISNAFGFYDQQTLEGVNDFLDCLPMFGIIADLLHVTFDHFIDFLVLFNVNQQQIV